MRRWSGPPPNPAQFDITRVRQIGEWGNASRYLGSRWEEVGGERLRSALGEPGPAAVLSVYADPELAALLAATGSKNPDVVVAYDENGALILQPVDLKWSLDVASYQQISAGVLDTLLAKVPRLTEELRARVPEPSRDLPLATSDGFFFSPQTHANSRFLASPENRHQEYPLEPPEVLFETVEPYAFFEVLPGWATARELARLDGSSRGLGQIDAADRYYHFGAGVAGALAALDGSIFDERAPIDPEREVELLRAYLRTLTPPSTAAVLDRLGARMRERQNLIRRLRDLTRGAYTFKDLVAALVGAGLATEGQPERELRAQWGDRYRALIEAAEAEIREAGRAHRASGASDAEALEAVERDRAAIARRLRGRVEAMIRGVSGDG